MTVVVEETQAKTQTKAEVPESPRNALAPWHIRAGAFALDVLPGAAVVVTMALAALTVRTHPVWWWVCVSVLGVAILLTLVNRLVLPSIVGWSLGRALCGITVLHRDGEPLGVWGLLLRDLAHLLDTVSLVGWLWPLWDSRGCTFADMLLRTEARWVEPDRRPPNMRRWSAVAVITAAAVCVAGVGVSYLVVYSRDRESEQTKAQIQVQGPKIVAQMLTYDPKSLHDDFSRAQSLATDKYRHKLAEQQGIVEKGNPVINEYWVTDGSIESATPDRATMLLFMQGRRGVGPEQRYISATVRVSFTKGGNDRWLVDDLSVLTKPKPPGNGK